MVTQLREELRDEGLCRLRGFLTPAAITQLVEQAQAVEQHAYYGLREASPYFNDYDSKFPAEHPRNIRTRRELGLVAADLISADCILQKLYKSDALLHFLATLLNKEALYRLDDPYQRVNVTVMPEGAGHNWHFDSGDFVITLMLRKPEQGGNFECVPSLRSVDDENYEGVNEVLQGHRDNVRVVGFEPGTLMVFRGMYSLHRVSPVSGKHSRLNTVLTYSTDPGWKGDRALMNCCTVLGSWERPRTSDGDPCPLRRRSDYLICGHTKDRLGHFWSVGCRKDRSA